MPTLVYSTISPGVTNKAKIFAMAELAIAMPSFPLLDLVNTITAAIVMDKQLHNIMPVANTSSIDLVTSRIRVMP